MLPFQLHAHNHFVFKKATNSNPTSLVLGKQTLCSGLDYLEDAVLPADSYDVEELERYVCSR